MRNIVSPLFDRNAPLVVRVPGSTTRLCEGCAREVWVSPSSLVDEPNHFWCIGCARKNMPPGTMIVPPSLTQVIEMIAAGFDPAEAIRLMSERVDAATLLAQLADIEQQEGPGR